MRHPVVTQRPTKLKMRKKDTYILTTILAVNLLTFVWLLPYAQKTANSHMNSGPFLGTTLYFISGILLFLGLNGLIQHRDYRFFILLFIFALTFWGYKLHSLMCLGCLNSG
jgi:hypothetical protein